MNALDLIFLCSLVYFGGRGLQRGVISELISIAGILLGLYVADGHYLRLAPLAETLLAHSFYVQLAAYVLIFAVVMFLVRFIVVSLKHLLNVTILPWADLGVGLLAGIVRGGMVCALLLLVLSSYIPSSPLVTRSAMAPAFAGAADFFARQIPHDLLFLLKETGFQRPGL
jgi:membrane protein required for colicin V production